MIRTISKFREELADREAIKDCIYLYSRALDRCDGELLLSVFWPDARIEADRFTVNPEQLVRSAIPTLRTQYDQLMHLIGNIVVRIDGDGAKAATESYFFGYQCFLGSGTRRDVIQNGRYLDRFERRNDEWRIAERVVLIDWYREFADSAAWSPGPLGLAVARGERAPDDRSYPLFAEP